MSKPYNSHDAKLAWQIHNQINSFDVTGVTENAAFPNSSKENYRPKSLIDNTLEIIDPTPNIHTLFVQFNKKFFSNKLLSVEVKWSHRMTSCAGTCTFNTGSRYCVIALSSPLLKLRPRKDLVETLLHEMIHAFLFVTNNNRDRDGHGPEFCKHMSRINKEAGTNITIYHTFHAEVKLYQQHWWRCNGPCQKKHPFFGMVRRAMNRAPGPKDFWWREHELTCGGQFIKVREPEKPETKGKKAKVDPKKPNIEKWLIPSPDNKPKSKPGTNDFRKPKDKRESVPKKNSNNSFKTGGGGLKTKGGSSVLTVNKWNANANTAEPGIQKLGNTTNNVHGFGTGGPGTSSSSKASSGNHFAFSGTLGGSGTGQSRLLQIFGSQKTLSDKNEKEKNQDFGPTVKCPVCKDLILERIANSHIDACLVSREKKNKGPFINSTPRVVPGKNNKEIKGNDTNCPICSESFPASLIENHIDLCLTNVVDENPAFSDTFETPASSFSSVGNIDSSFENSTQSINDSSTPSNKKRKIPDYFNSQENKKSKSDRDVHCPVCTKIIKFDEMNSHLDDCLSEIGEEVNEAGPSRENPKRDPERKDPKTDLERKNSKVDPERKNFKVDPESKNPKVDPERKNHKTDSESKNPKVDPERKNDKPETCIICNEILNPEIPLSQHLDDCLRNMFNDDSSSSEESFVKETEEPQEKNCENKSENSVEIIEINDTLSDEEIDLEKETSNRFPCPVCMTLIPQNEMNQHLNSCLE